MGNKCFKVKRIIDRENDPTNYNHFKRTPVPNANTSMNTYIDDEKNINDNGKRKNENINGFSKNTLVKIEEKKESIDSNNTEINLNKINLNAHNINSNLNSSPNSNTNNTNNKLKEFLSHEIQIPENEFPDKQEFSLYMENEFKKNDIVSGGGGEFHIEGNIRITQTASSMNRSSGTGRSSSNSITDKGLLAQLFNQNNISFFTPNQEKIENNYTFIRKLGNGAFGKCNLAQLKKGNKDIRYAIKTIELESIDKDKLILLKTEISCLKRLVHPNIVHFFQLFYDNSNIHMVMEPCMNGSLFDKILEKGRFSEKTATKIMISLLSALNYCHKNKIIHRDIKPENNLLVNPTTKSTSTIGLPSTSNANVDESEWEYDLRLIDFGLGHIYSKKENSLLSSSVGSPYFMAPEVLNECYNSKCDVWSLGILFYFLIAGVPPFYSDNIPELFQMVLKSQPSFKSEIWKNVSDDVKSTIRFMLIKDFRKRPSCEELLKLKCFEKELGKLHNDEKLNKEKNENLIHCLYLYLQNKNAFIKEVCGVMANQLSTSDFKKASSLFKIIDKENNGEAPLESLKKYFKEKQLDQKIFKNVNCITYQDIIEAISYRKFFADDFCTMAFETFDIDEDGYINFKDFSSSVFKDATKISKMELDFIISEVGLDKKFKLSLSDFKKLLIGNVKH